MKRTSRPVRAAAAAATVLLLVPAIAASLNVDQPTFVDDIAPILHENCASCHQPDEIGPMSLRTYREARPWARSIARAVENRDMPPWDADPGYGPWANDISLSDSEIAAITRWAATGAPRGEGDEPVYRRPETDGEWTFGEPDWVYEFDPYEVTADGPDEFLDIPIKTGFKEDRWIRAVEVQAGDRTVLHHFILWRAGDDDRTQQGWVGAWAAGFAPQHFPTGTGRLLPKGQDLIGDFHYHPTGTAAVDKTRVALWFAEPEEVERELVNLWVINFGFRIPAGEADYRAKATHVFDQDVIVRSFTPHMHYRGKSMTYTAFLPGGEQKELLSVSNYDFNWQMSYDLAEPLRLPAGTRIEVAASFDNSADNPNNPDPTVDVTWGNDSRDEMLIGFVDYVAADSAAAKAATPAGPAGQ